MLAPSAIERKSMSPSMAIILMIASIVFLVAILILAYMACTGTGWTGIHRYGSQLSRAVKTTYVEPRSRGASVFDADRVVKEVISGGRHRLA